DELLRRLSPDFMSIEDRALAVAKKEIDGAELRVKIMQIWVPVLIAAVTLAGGAILSYQKIDTRLKTLEATTPDKRQIEQRLGKLEALLPLEERVAKVEKTVDDLKNKKSVK